jgi:hypothetical protein
MLKIVDYLTSTLVIEDCESLTFSQRNCLSCKNNSTSIPEVKAYFFEKLNQVKFDQTFRTNY